MPELRDNRGACAGVLLAVAALSRIILLCLPHPFYSTVPPFDGSYIDSAQSILSLDFRALGDRAPLYPLLVALCGLNHAAIWIVQSVLGVAASLMIFDLAFRRTRHALGSLLIALAASLVPEILVYEASTGTETLTNFLLVASVWLIARWNGARGGGFRYPLGLGLVISLAGLTRPLMIAVVPIYFAFLVPLWPPARMVGRESLRKAAWFALPVIILIGGWCEFNYLNSGYFTPTTRAGQQLMDQVNPYVDLAPEQYAEVRDIWLQYRGQMSDFSNGTAEELYGEALPEMERRTGKSEAQVSHELASMALYLEIHHPLESLRRAEQGWMQFWGEPFSNEIAWPQAGKVRLVECLTALANFAVREIKAVFLVLALLSAVCAACRRRVFSRIEYLIFAFVTWVSIFAAFTEFGNNRRFCVPFYMLIIFGVLTRLWLWVREPSPEAAE